MQPKGANSMAVSGRKVLPGTRRAISVVFGINGLRSEPSCLPFPFFSYGRLVFTGTLDCKFVNWWVWLKPRSCLILPVGAV